MTLFSIAKKNVWRNFSNYFLYIASMAFSILIYFIFVTLKYSDTIEKEIETSQKIGSLMNGASVILLFFVAIFIFYCNSFFMKKRKKEVALYALLGVRKRQIASMLFFENLLLGCMSLVIGILLGFVASKGILTILIQLMGYDVIAPFTFSFAAILHTAIVFFILFFVTSLLGARMIYKFKLIELFRASSEGEAVPKVNVIVALLGVVLVSFGYFLALQDMLTSMWWRKIGIMLTPVIILGTVIVGTYLVFHSFTGMILQLLKKAESWVWRGLRVVTISQLLYRVRAQAKTLSVIAILSATTITAGGAVFSLYYNTTSDVQKIDPNTFMLEHQPKLDAKIDNVVGDTQFDAVVPTLLTRFQAPDLSYMENGEMEYTVISQTMYNRLAKVHEREALHTTANEVYVLDPSYDARYSPQYKKAALTANKQSFIIKDVRPFAVLNAQMAYVTVVMNDAQYEQLAKNKASKAVSYRVIEDDTATKETSKQMAHIVPSDVPFSNQIADTQASIESIGVLLFIGSFLGLVFLVATGSIIYFKMLTEIEEDRSKYVIMHKMGISLKEMRRSLATQNAAIFVAPLLIALLHSAVALKAFSSLFNMDLLVPVSIWMLAFTAVYAIFYVVTVSSCMKIVKQTIQVEGK